MPRPLLSAFESQSRYAYFEHKALYRSISEGRVWWDYYTIPFGKAKLVREGNDLTIVTYGLGVHWALEALTEHKDIRCWPDWFENTGAIGHRNHFESVKNRACHCYARGYAYREASQAKLFDFGTPLWGLDAPVMREGSPIRRCHECGFEHNFYRKNGFKKTKAA